MLIGDVLSFVASLLAIAFTSWALLLAFGLLFPRRVADAATEIDRNVWPLALIGGAAWLVPGGISLALLSAGPGPVKVLGFVGIAWLLAIGGVGAAGLARTMERRMEGVQGFARTSRATAILIGSVSLPIVGWLVVGPAILAIGTGAGIRALLRPERPPVVVTEGVTTETAP